MITPPEVAWIAIAPDLTLALGAALVLLIDVQWKPRARVLGAAAAGCLLVATGFALWQWLESGDAAFAAPQFSGMMMMDRFAIFTRLVLLVATGLGLLAGWRFITGLGRRGAEALALVLLASAGFSLMVASNNLVMMFLGLEVGSIALYVLAGLTRENPESDEAALKYFLLGSFASAVFVYGVALLYAGTGTFSIIDIRSLLAGSGVADPAVVYIGIGLVVAGLGFKVSAAPFHTWAPDVYQGAPAGIVGYMAAAAKIAGFAALTRVLLAGVGDLDATWLPVVAAIATLSMLVGSVVALVQGDVRRMLAYSGIAHAGFILTGVVGGASDGVLFYLAVYAIQLVGAFAVVAAVSGPDGARSSIDQYRGLGRRSPVLAGSFTVLLLALAGIPLTSGFVAKFAVLSDAWAADYQWLVVVAVLASVIALAFYIRVIVVMYMDDSEDPALPVVATVRLVLGLAVAATLLFGVFPGSLLDLAADALPL
jgi:NADH-quinone oxidoreductase subunit N